MPPQVDLQMIKLYGVGSAWGLPDFSSFVTKVDCYLRMVQLPYEYVSINDPSNWRPDLPMPPKGKVPYIEDDGEIVADSQFIIEHLKKKYGDRLGDDELTSEEGAIALGMRRLIEEHLYWVLVYSRWTDDATWEDYNKKILPTFSYAELVARRELTIRDLRGH